MTWDAEKKREWNKQYRKTPKRIAYDLAYGKRYRKTKACKDAMVRWRAKVSGTHDMWFRRVKGRALHLGIEFNITPEDVLWPDVCPVLGLPIKAGKGKPNDNSPSCDRINPELGYVPGNVRVICQRANRLKDNCTDPHEMLAIARYVAECNPEPTWLRTPREGMRV